MPNYFVIDARFSFSSELDNSLSTSHQDFEAQQPRTKSAWRKLSRTRSGSISIESFNTVPVSPVNRFAHSMGIERTKYKPKSIWRRYTPPATSTSVHGYQKDDPSSLSYAAKSNRRSAWRRFTENVDKCLYRMMSKFYK
ncbi:uncharacterized protein PHALS_04328 [Plasmopara halstedii]|uniref:Uncharacterized protein n=1 Tax=Plasmopara halstedii TaxID=4781 RepID=A0A0P1B180_PLAHL|nr:uncharacterized protein PHALS_04328 [Plasmopara halstedii]CEG47455.1 hypothetical protein PHALS_04328 [Plasmopara halstedii]|eukprot:XP_024583824.1 hypothetical protein PHALS_04328 [Plasmopara halstedii]